jgi:hypothetical protein
MFLFKKNKTWTQDLKRLVDDHVSIGLIGSIVSSSASIAEAVHHTVGYGRPNQILAKLQSDSNFIKLNNSLAHFPSACVGVIFSVEEPRTFAHLTTLVATHQNANNIPAATLPIKAIVAITVLNVFGKKKLQKQGLYTHFYNIVVKHGLENLQFPKDTVKELNSYAAEYAGAQGNAIYEVENVWSDTQKLSQLTAKDIIQISSAIIFHDPALDKTNSALLLLVKAALESNKVAIAENNSTKEITLKEQDIFVNKTYPILLTKILAGQNIAFKIAIKGLITVLPSLAQTVTIKQGETSLQKILEDQGFTVIVEAEIQTNMFERKGPSNAFEDGQKPKDISTTNVTENPSPSDSQDTQVEEIGESEGEGEGGAEGGSEGGSEEGPGKKKRKPRAK